MNMKDHPFTPIMLVVVPTITLIWCFVGWLFDLPWEYVLVFVVIIMTIYSALWLFMETKIDGNIIISENREGNKLFSLELEKSPEELEDMNVISFKVIKSDTSGFVE
jgi:hypothetical protein